MKYGKIYHNSTTTEANTKLSELTSSVHVRAGKVKIEDKHGPTREYFIGGQQLTQFVWTRHSQRPGPGKMSQLVLWPNKIQNAAITDFKKLVSKIEKMKTKEQKPVYKNLSKLVLDKIALGRTPY